jgi:hypothetical protein
MRLTEFGKAIGKGQGQEAGSTFKEHVWAEADFASRCKADLRWGMSRAGEKAP